MKRNAEPEMLPSFLHEQPTNVGHPGLRWERFGFGYRDSRGAYSADKKAWANDLAKSAVVDKEETAARAAALEAYAERLKRIVEAPAQFGAPPGVVFKLRLASNLVIGMGLPSPVENSLMFHPTLGCPYLPGSTLKGAVEAFVDEWVNTQPEEVQAIVPEEFRRIFGQPHRLRGKDRHAENVTGLGSVIFMDAVPLQWPRLVPDVMTPHVGDYLTNENGRLSESNSPKPIYFQVVAPGVEFQFAFRPTRPRAGGDPSEIDTDCALAAGWLVATLENLGIGAKTKAGYGRFKRL